MKKYFYLGFLLSFPAFANIAIDMLDIENKLNLLAKHSTNSQDKQLSLQLREKILVVESDLDYIKQNSASELWGQIQIRSQDMLNNAQKNQYKTLAPLFASLFATQNSTDNINNYSNLSQADLSKLNTALVIIEKSTLDAAIKETLTAKIKYLSALHLRLVKAGQTEVKIKTIISEIKQLSQTLNQRVATYQTAADEKALLSNVILIASISLLIITIAGLFLRKRKISTKVQVHYTSTLLTSNTIAIFNQSQVKFWIEDYLDEENRKKNIVVSDIKTNPTYQKVLQKMVSEPTLLVDQHGKILNMNDQFTAVFSQVATWCKAWDEVSNCSLGNDFDPIVSSRYFGGESTARYIFNLFGERQEFEAHCLPLKNDASENVYLITLTEIQIKTTETEVQFSA